MGESNESYLFKNKTLNKIYSWLSSKPPKSLSDHSAEQSKKLKDIYPLSDYRKKEDNGEIKKILKSNSINIPQKSQINQGNVQHKELKEAPIPADDIRISEGPLEDALVLLWKSTFNCKLSEKKFLLNIQSDGIELDLSSVEIKDHYGSSDNYIVVPGRLLTIKASYVGNISEFNDLDKLSNQVKNQWKQILMKRMKSTKLKTIKTENNIDIAIVDKPHDAGCVLPFIVFTFKLEGSFALVLGNLLYPKTFPASLQNLPRKHDVEQKSLESDAEENNVVYEVYLPKINGHCPVFRPNSSNILWDYSL